MGRLHPIKRGAAVRPSCQMQRVWLQVWKRGFYPKGGGQVQLRVRSWQGQPAWQGVQLLEQPPLWQVHIRTFTAGKVAEKVGSRMADAAQQVIEQVRTGLEQ